MIPLVYVLFLLLLAAAARLVCLVARRGRVKRNGVRKEPCSTLVVLGSGGHTAEMIQVLGGLNLQNYQPRTYVAAEGDSMSVEKVKAFESRQGCQACVRKIPSQFSTACRSCFVCGLTLSCVTDLGRAYPSVPSRS